MNRDAFNRHVLLRKDREHSWRHHARNGTLLKEVLGILDKWAAREEKKTGYRFVFAHQDTILNICFKGKREDGKPFSLTQLKRIFDKLRTEHIISRYFKTGDGRWGFVVAPHDSLCYVKDNVCYLPDRSIALPALEPLFPPASIAALAALKAAPIWHSTRHRDDTQHGTDTALNTAPASRIEDTEHGTEHGTDESLYLSNCELLSENEKALWLESRKQLGASIPCIRLSVVSDKPYKPSSPGIQDELTHHHEFLERHKQRPAQEQQQEQVKSKDVGLSFPAGLKTETPKTEKSKAAPMKSQNRKTQVLTPDEYQKVKVEKELKAVFGESVPVVTEHEVRTEKDPDGVRRTPCQVGNEVHRKTDEDRIAQGYTVLSICTVRGGFGCSFGEACWHKA